MLYIHLKQTEYIENRVKRAAGSSTTSIPSQIPKERAKTGRGLILLMQDAMQTNIQCFFHYIFHPVKDAELEKNFRNLGP